MAHISIEEGPPGMLGLSLHKVFTQTLKPFKHRQVMSLLYP
jgi:hypothetical protein